MPCDHPPSFSLPFQVPILHFNGLTCSCQAARATEQKWAVTNKWALNVWNFTQHATMDKFNKSDKKSLRLTHSEICCFSSPLSDRHQCRGTISKGDLNISLGIGAMVVLRNAASRPFSPRSNSSVGAEKEISPQHPGHACSWPEPQLSEKMLMQALSVFSERRHALFKPASVWRGGSSLPHHPFHCSHPYSSSGLSVCSNAQDWRLPHPMGAFLPPERHVPTPWCRSQKIEFSPLLRLFWRSTIK